MSLDHILSLTTHTFKLVTLPGASAPTKALLCKKRVSCPRFADKPTCSACKVRLAREAGEKLKRRKRKKRWD